jgi:hypothetical protein
MDRIEELAESLRSFFLVFDGLFLHENDTEQLLAEVQKSLEEKIQHNETALALIIAVGGSYDSDVDRAKVEETKALLNLIKARKQLKEATEKASRKTTVNREVLALFGL